MWDENFVTVDFNSEIFGIDIQHDGHDAPPRQLFRTVATRQATTRAHVNGKATSSHNHDKPDQFAWSAGQTFRTRIPPPFNSNGPGMMLDMFHLFPK